MEFEIKDTKPFTLATTTKCCSKNLTNYKKKRKKMREEIKGPNKLRDILCVWIGRFNIFKMSVFPKLLYVQTNLSPNLTKLFGE